MIGEAFEAFLILLIIMGYFGGLVYCVFEIICLKSAIANLRDDVDFLLLKMSSAYTNVPTILNDAEKPAK